MSTLTIKYTDIYLRRVYRLLQKNLYPDSTVFLGDLFDGGREWSTAASESPEKQWRGYGEKFWINEYKRFSSIFFDIWTEAGITQSNGVERRNLLSNLPGNHDLGFAAGIQKPVRDRFNAYFGEGSRIDILGNHTFVSLDTVSLSAKDDGSDKELWQPSQDFLDQYPTLLNTRIAQHLSHVVDGHQVPSYRHQVVDTDGLESDKLPSRSNEKLNLFPSILLTHVPLYRDQGTPCGPLREHWPPTLDNHRKPLENDDRNSITVARGYQYQNVLSLETSKEITNKLVNLSYAFSGDDHDYCEVLHRQYPSSGGGIRETTVKSISWAMGVRKPGVQLISLWNPVQYSDSSSNFHTQSPPQSTLQSHLCLLPDQLEIFINYAFLLLITLGLLLSRALYLAYHPSASQLNNRPQSLLPTTRNASEVEKGESSSSEDSNGNPSARSRLLVRTMSDRTRSSSPRTSTGYGLPSLVSQQSKINQQSVGYAIKKSLKKSLDPKSEFSLWGTPAGGKQLKGHHLFMAEFKRSFIQIAIFALPWYAWLLWHG